MELKGTKTEKNLMEAFAGESMARNKYTLRRLQATRKSTPSCGSRPCAAARSPTP